MENTVNEVVRIDPSQVKGWGVDADPKNDPTYPMKRRNNGEHAGTVGIVRRSRKAMSRFCIPTSGHTSLRHSAHPRRPPD
jgi:hypothetical protein